jgi:hypothetical protein
MKLACFFSRQLRWLNLPGALLLALLQRSPAVQVASTAAEFVAASPIGAVLRSASLVAASLGAIHSMAGATLLVTNSPSPLSATTGTALSSVVFGVSGTQGPPSSWVIGGSIPSGLSFSGRTTAGTVNVSSLTLTGTPTVAGNYTVTLRAWENTNATGNGSPTYNYQINVSGAANTAPAITTQPVSQTVTAGAGVTFTGAASGSPTPTYQWNFNGAAIGGATSASYTIGSAQAANAGSYTVTATNSAGTATSSAATLTVNAAATAPAITTQPVSQTVTAGAGVTFAGAASGSPTPTYQWNFNGAAIGGATSASYTIGSAQAANAGSYTVTATNSAGTATSSAATLTVNAAATVPAITTQPVSQTVAPGASVTFTAAASGSPTPTYQWNFNGAAIGGATSASYTIGSAQAANAGSYTVTATNSAGSATSSAATLTVNAAATVPAFTTQPASQTVAPGASATFSATASGSPTPTYQWNFNGAAISGATSASYTISSAQAANAGSYTVKATNSAGSATSNSATLTVSAVATAPTFTTQPVSQTVAPGASVTFTAAASGSPTPTYQWNFNGAAIGGATSASYTLGSAQAANAGSYTVTATNSAGSATSSAATLTVSAVATAPTISTQPASQTVNAGQSVTFAVVASGSSLTYQWQKNGAAIAGATGASYTVSNAQSPDAASFTVVISSAGSSVTSTAAVLTVNATAAAGPTARITNLSILTTLTSATDTFTLGYVVGNSSAASPLPLVLRAAGPALGALGYPGTMADPKLETYAGSAKTGENDNWGGTAALKTSFASVGAFPYASDASKDAAVVASITTRDNSVKISSADGGTGAVIAEVYDATPTGNFNASSPRLINVSVLKPIGTSLTVGFVIGGSGTKTVLIRALGPTLATLFGFPASSIIVDPKLELFNGASQSIGTNDNWGGTAALSSAIGAAGTFALDPASKDAALVATLSPGNYTVVVGPAAGATGTGLVEVYELP